MRSYLCCTLFVLAAVLHADYARAINVPEGCAVPKPLTGRNSFYVDPAKGKMSNDGSANLPWSTLAEVLDSKKKLVRGPAARIQPGDIIYLRSGDHGNVQLADATNRDFITVQAEPAQTPTLRSLRVNSSAKWIFSGLSVQGAGDGSTNSAPGLALIEFGRDASRGETSDILFFGNSISTTGDSSSWTNEDWVKKPFLAGLSSAAACVTISGNHFFNLRNAIGIEGDRSLVEGNRIENFGNDGIDVVASHVTIRKNSIKNGRYSKSEPSHPDGIQGWTKNDATNRNVVIDGNIIIKTGDPQITEMQGIGIYDGKWDGLIISNNVVVTNHWNGISVGGISNAKIINNTVVAYDPLNRPTWIRVDKAKDGRPSKNVVVRNNITTRLALPEEGVVADHNLVSKMISTTVDGKPVFNSKPGSYGQNRIDPNVYDSLTNVDHARGIYDLRLKPNSPAAGRGNADQAPAVDIVGKRRVAPVDIGAYAR
jgi:hypothetical protein